MLGATDIIDPDERMLARLAELDASLAAKVHGLAMAESDPEIVASLARGYQKIARSLRQTLALKSKLRLDREKARREQPATEPPRDEARIARAREAVGRAVLRVIEAAEIEREEADYLTDVLDDRLRLLAVKGTRDLRGLDEEVSDLCDDLGLDATGWQDLPDPPPRAAAAPAPVEWRSSA